MDNLTEGLLLSTLHYWTQCNIDRDLWSMRFAFQFRLHQCCLWEPSEPSTAWHGYQNCLSAKINNDPPHHVPPPGYSRAPSRFSSPVSRIPRWPRVLGLAASAPASLASANVNITSECRSLASGLSPFSPLIFRLGADCYLKTLSLATSRSRSRPQLRLSEWLRHSPTLPPVSDTRKPRPGDENREGEGELLSDVTCVERAGRSIWHRATAAVPGVESPGAGTGAGLIILVISETTWTPGHHGEQQTICQQ